MNLRPRDRLLLGLFIGGEGAKACPSAKLFLWTEPKYSRKKFRLLAARLARENLIQQTIIEGKVNFRLTEAGREQLWQHYPKLRFSAVNWDGFWRLAIFDIPEADRELRNQLRLYLIKMGFGVLQASVYLSAQPYQPEFLAWLKAKRLEKSVLLLESKQKYLGEPQALAEKVWQLENLNSGYKKIIEKLSTRFGLKDDWRRTEFLKKIYRDWLALFLADPGLPPEFLTADWQGLKSKNFLLRAGAVRE